MQSILFIPQDEIFKWILIVLLIIFYIIMYIISFFIKLL